MEETIVIVIRLLWRTLVRGYTVEGALARLRKEGRTR